MIAFTQAQSQIRTHAHTLSSESVSLDQSCGRVLSADILAPSDSPLFDNAAMDGVVARCADIQQASPENPVHLKVEGSIYAGGKRVDALKSGTVCRIATGARVPAGGEVIYPKEMITLSAEGGRCTIDSLLESGKNIRRQGEHYRAGAVLLPTGRRISPPDLALLASLGCAEVPCRRKPLALVISTGGELQPPGAPLSGNQIYDSNSYLLAELARRAGCETIRYGGLGDDPEQILQILHRHAARVDLIFLSGGMSVGDRDYSIACFEKLGVQQVFHKLRVKPGKPFYFGVLDSAERGNPRAESCKVFGFPGNPVAVDLLFAYCVAPLIEHMLQTPAAPSTLATLQSPIRSSPGRAEILLGNCIEAAKATQTGSTRHFSALPKQSAANLAAAAACNASLLVSAETTELTAGSLVELQMRI